ncbi:MAG: glycerol-3-phosphate acyltransferase [Chloroflexi bacterium]|nr:glycerol-3-phosphate acyltransferase [Chloroflexota bacterium]
MDYSDTLIAVAFVLGVYLVGSIPSSYLVGRLVGGVDIREHGSKNLGSSNLAAQVGAWWAVPVAPFDILVKGALPVFIASEKVLGLGLGVEAAAGIAGVVGHNWSIFTRFQGGRGMATVLGATGALNFPLLVVYGSVPALGVLFTPWKDSAVWWLIAVIAMPVWAALLNLPIEIVWFSIAFAFVTAAKRMTSNTLVGSDNRITASLLWTRLLFDRDLADREEWLKRSPE